MRRMRSPMTGCSRMTIHSWSSSGASLRRISLGVPILPTSWSSATVSTSTIRSGAQAQPHGDAAGERDGLLAVAAGVAVAGLERRAERDEAGAVLGREVGLAAARQRDQALVLALGELRAAVAQEEDRQQPEHGPARDPVVAEAQRDEQDRQQDVADDDAARGAGRATWPRRAAARPGAERRSLPAAATSSAAQTMPRCHQRSGTIRPPSPPSRNGTTVAEPSSRPATTSHASGRRATGARTGAGSRR